MGINISRNANNYTLTVKNGAAVEDIYIGKIAVVGQLSNNFIYIYYEGNLYISGLYSLFVDGNGNPLGNSVQTVEAAIAALLFLPSSGGGGTCCPITPFPSAATTLSPASIQFDGKTVYLLSASGTITVNLPDAATVTIGSVLRFSMQGGGILKLFSFGSGNITLDGQPYAGGGSGWIIPQPNYTVPPNLYLPAQTFGIYTPDNVNWVSAVNF